MEKKYAPQVLCAGDDFVQGVDHKPLPPTMNARPVCAHPFDRRVECLRDCCGPRRQPCFRPLSAEMPGYLPSWVLNDLLRMDAFTTVEDHVHLADCITTINRGGTVPVDLHTLEDIFYIRETAHRRFLNG